MSPCIRKRNLSEFPFALVNLVRCLSCASSHFPFMCMYTEKMGIYETTKVSFLPSHFDFTPILACASLKTEFESICYRPPAPQAVAETKAFCEAYRQSCHRFISKTKTKPRIDVATYCRKHRERFRFVCPDPTRFRKYSEDAIEFCNRYRSFCPNEPLPDKPQPFAPKQQYICDLYDDWAKIYCLNPVILKIPKYQFNCLLYKQHCIDTLMQVVYYGYHP